MFFVLLTCACALVVLFINQRIKLPKIIFLIIVVLIVVSLCRFTFDFNSTKSEERNDKELPVKRIFFEVARDVSFSAGETRVAIPEIGATNQRLCAFRVRFVCHDNFTEQLFVDKVRFSALLSNGEILPAHSVYIENKDSKVFPEDFLLKIFFEGNKITPSVQIKCLMVDNGFEHILVAPEVSIGG